MATRPAAERGMILWSATTCRRFLFQWNSIYGYVGSINEMRPLKSKAVTSHRSPKLKSKAATSRRTPYTCALAVLCLIAGATSVRADALDRIRERGTLVWGAD